MNILLSRLDWRFAKSLGELQILTRTSYAMLVIVPILAGIWSALPIREITGDLPTHAELLAALDQLRAHDYGNADGRNVMENLNRIAAALKLAKYPLPHVWVYAFLAALAVTLAQVIYQLRAPELVRHSTLDGYVSDAREKYEPMERPPSSGDVDDARSYLDLASHPELSLPEFISYYNPAQRIAELETKIENVVKNNPFVYEYINEGKSHSEESQRKFDQLMRYLEHEYKWHNFGDYVLRELNDRLQKGMFYTPGERDPELVLVMSEVVDLIWYYVTKYDSPQATNLHNIEKVANQFSLRYIILSHRKRWAMLSSSFLYVAAILIIGIITVDQTRAVLIAARWL